jgi:hypothetical protein
MHELRNITLALLFALGTAGTAVAQQVPGSPEIPTNVSPTASLCAEGFAWSDYNADGIVTRADLGRYDDFFYHADSNSDGFVNRAEFNSACSENLFDRLDQQSG